MNLMRLIEDSSSAPSLIVGNGLSIDLCKFLGSQVDPSAPFSFDIPDPFDNNKKLLDTLTRVRDMITSHPNMTDFDIIQSFVNNYQLGNRGAHTARTGSKSIYERQWIHCELRHYLSLAYSYANNILQRRWNNDWGWAQWLRSHSERIAGIVSFNYDLILEMALQRLSLGYYRIDSAEEDNPVGIPIFKPHGSCDFDIGGISIPPQSRFKCLTRQNNHVINGRGRVAIVPETKLMEPRTEADIVLPFEISPQTNLTWVRQGYETISQMAKTVDRCVIVGLAYHICDRREIDAIMDIIPRTSAIQLVTPKPNREFEEKLKGISNRVKHIDPEEFLSNVT